MQRMASVNVLRE